MRLHPARTTRTPRRRRLATLVGGLATALVVLASTAAPASANSTSKSFTYGADGSVSAVLFGGYDVSRRVYGWATLTVRPNGQWQIDGSGSNDNAIARKARWQCHVSYGSDLVTGAPATFTVKTGKTSVPGGKTRTISASGTSATLTPAVFDGVVAVGSADCDIVIG
jgi:hypothetical protein